MVFNVLLLQCVFLPNTRLWDLNKTGKLKINACKDGCIEHVEVADMSRAPQMYLYLRPITSGLISSETYYNQIIIRHSIEQSSQK
jgi:hypothetical protein